MALPPLARLFFARVWRHWVLLMSGLAGIAFGAITVTFSSLSAALAFWAVALVCITVAAYRVWLDEYRGRQVDAAHWEAERGELLARLAAASDTLRAELDALIRQGEAFVGAFGATDPPGLVDASLAWLGRARAFVGEHAPELLGDYLRAMMHPVEDERDPVAVAFFLHQALDVLKLARARAR